MKAFKIADVKDFMSKLLIGEVFDSFSFVEGSVTTYCTFNIDGLLRQEFFDTDVQTAMKEKHVVYASWKEIRPHYYSFIKGKRTPLSFKIVFQLSHYQTEQILKNAQLPISIDMVSGLFLNIQYKNNELLCTSGVSLKTFLPDKSLERHWDTVIPGFFKKNQIPFEEL
ncbi:MAG: hypothetical protein KBT01_09740 [Clostridiales bacterium]|nr:hypothetical protein [Candidatus Blautia equi]